MSSFLLLPRAVVVGTLFILSTTAVHAQNIGQNSGQVRGSVTDQSGAVLPGVLVTATSPSLPGPQIATTDAKGEFRFPALPFGAYRVEAALQGFVSRAVEGLELRTGETLRVSLKLQPGFEQTVNVDSSATVIDVTSSSKAAHITAEQIQDLPKDRYYDTLAVLAPGINRDNQTGTPSQGDVDRGLSVQGATISENVFIVDGADTSNNMLGINSQDVVMEFVEDIQVKAGGFDAQFGGALGGVISVATKSGGNQFRGGVTLQYGGDALSALQPPQVQLAPDNLSAFYFQNPKERFSQFDVGFFVGGPIRKDRLWFFAGVVPQYVDIERDIAYTAGGQGTFKRKTRREFASAKLTWRASDAVKVNLSYNYSPFGETGVLPAPQSLIAAPSQDLGAVKGKNNAHTVTANIDWVPNKTFLVNAFAGYYLLDGFQGIPQASRVQFATGNAVFANIPATLKGGASFSSVPSNLGDLTRDQSRPSFGVSGTAFFKAAGDHTFKTGLQYAAPYTDVNNGFTGGFFTMSWDLTDSVSRQRGAYGFYRAWDLNTTGEIKSSNMALFVQDSWQLSPRLTLNLGLRTERESIRTASRVISQPPSIDFGFADKIAPRVGFAWDAKGDGRLKVYGSTGFFYDTLKHGLARTAFAGSRSVQTFYRLDDFDWTKLSLQNPGALGAPIRTVVLSTLTPSPLDPDLKATRSWEAAIGAEHQLTSHTAIGARYTNKRLQNAIQIINLAPTGVGAGTNAVANPGDGIATQPYGPNFPAQPKFQRRYNGIELTWRRRMANRWMGNLNYTYSTLRGNYDGIANTDDWGNGISPNAGATCAFLEGCFTPAGAVEDGPLSLDRPHQVKAYGAYRLPFGLTAGVFFQYLSGFPFEKEASINTEPAVTVRLIKLRGRGGDGRSEALTQTDFSLEYDLKLKGNRKLALSANFQNAFNQRAGTSRFSNAFLSGISVPRATFFKGVDLEALARAANVRVEPRSGYYWRFQEQRRIRLGLRFDF